MNNMVTWPLISSPLKVYGLQDDYKYLYFTNPSFSENDLSKALQQFNVGDHVYVLSMFVGLKEIGDIISNLYRSDLII